LPSTNVVKIDSQHIEVIRRKCIEDDQIGHEISQRSRSGSEPPTWCTPLPDILAHLLESCKGGSFTGRQEEKARRFTGPLYAQSDSRQSDLVNRSVQLTGQER
jgi:hypothetical protein